MVTAKKFYPCPAHSLCLKVSLCSNTCTIGLVTFCNQMITSTLQFSQRNHFSKCFSFGLSYFKGPDCHNTIFQFFLTAKTVFSRENAHLKFLPFLCAFVLQSWEPGRCSSFGISIPGDLLGMVTMTLHKGCTYMVTFLYESRNGLGGGSGLDQQPDMHHSVVFSWHQTLSSRKLIKLKHQNYEL